VVLWPVADGYDVPVTDLDDLDTRALVARDPATFVSGAAPALIDEF
jgi:hypothetical protein